MHRYGCFYRLKDHIADKTKLPILIFPEGMFLHGIFILNITVYVCK